MIQLRQGIGDMTVDLLIHRVARRANGILDRERTGAAMGDDRHAVQADQRRAAVFGVIQAPIGFARARCG